MILCPESLARGVSLERLLKYNLQFFAESAGEKTEEPTTKKLTDARKEGQVAKSTDLVTAFSLLAFFITIKFLIASIGNKFIISFNEFYINIDKVALEEFNIVTVKMLLNEGIFAIIKILLPILIVSFSVAFIINVFQVRWQPTGKPLMPKFSRLSPAQGIKRIFSKDKIIQLFKEIIKIGAIIYIAYDTLKDYSITFFRYYDMDVLQSVLLTGEVVIDLGVSISVLFLILGFADFIYQKFKFKKDMRMTKQEIKDEYKQTEGDPQIKSRIKSKMREASQRRMMQDIPKADVVITNPTHFAAAIKYDREVSEAPVLVAKGADHLAAKIKEIAKENKVEIVENKPLARMLYYNVEIGNEIPPELYQLTAEVLAFVYSLKK